MAADTTDSRHGAAPHLKVLRRAVRAVHSEKLPRREAPRIAVLRDRQQLQRCEAEVRDVAQPPPRRHKGALGGEGADVELVDEVRLDAGAFWGLRGPVFGVCGDAPRGVVVGAQRVRVAAVEGVASARAQRHAVPRTGAQRGRGDAGHKVLAVAAQRDLHAAERICVGGAGEAQCAELRQWRDVRTTNTVPTSGSSSMAPAEAGGAVAAGSGIWSATSSAAEAAFGAQTRKCEEPSSINTRPCFVVSDSSRMG